MIIEPTDRVPIDLLSNKCTPFKNLVLLHVLAPELQQLSE